MAALQERGRLLGVIRRFFSERDVLEVQTAVLGACGVTDVAIENVEAAGGFLQSSPEFQMKRLLAAGSPSIYQICPAFRAGEAGTWHNPEFSMLEWYRLNFDAPSLMAELTELVDLVLGGASYETMTVAQLLQSQLSVDLYAADDVLHEAAGRAGLVGSHPRDEVLDFLIATAIPQLAAQRVFVTEYPADQAALAKTAVVDGHEVALRFELVIEGLEVANGYDELTDAAELETRMQTDNRKRAERGLLPKAADQHLLDAMFSGLPRCAGVAVGLDRLFALAVGATGIAEVMAFPADRA